MSCHHCGFNCACGAIEDNEELKAKNKKLLEALKNLYDAGYWVLSTDEVNLEKEIELWEAAKQVIKENTDES